MSNMKFSVTIFQIKCLSAALMYRVRQKETGLYCGVLEDTDYPLDFLIAQATVIFPYMIEGLKLNS